MKNIVTDSNVFFKLMREEPDTGAAKDFYKACIKEKINLLAPELFKYEISAISCRSGVPLSKTMEMLKAQINASVLTIVAPPEKVWLKAEEITKHGHPKSGYPSFYDSVFHALAIET